MFIVLLILGALGLLVIGAGWLQNVTTAGAAHMQVDMFGWTLGPLSHGAWLLVASLFGMLTLACLAGAFALFRRAGRTRRAATATAGTATAGTSAGRIREGATTARGREGDDTSRRWDTDRDRERVSAEEEQVTTRDEYATTGEEYEAGGAPGDVHDRIPHSDRGEYSDIKDARRSRAPDAARDTTADEQQEGSDLADKAKERAKDAKDAFGRTRDRR